MKKWLCAVLLGGSILTAPGADPYFAESIKHVDMGGEMLYYNNLSGLSEVVNVLLPELIKSGNIPDKEAQLYAQFVLNLLDIGSLRSVAGSSLKHDDGVYISKNVLLFAPDSKSLLCTPDGVNKVLNWRAVPAETVFACGGMVDLPALWQKVCAVQPEKFLGENAAILREAGAFISGVKGYAEILVAFQADGDIGFKILLPDATGSLSALLKSHFPAAPGKNVAPMPFLRSGAQLIYGQGSIVLISSEAMLQAPAKTLGTVPAFAAFGKHLDAAGTGYCVVQLNDAMAAAANFMLSAEVLKPFNLLAVERALPDGRVVTIASDFSIQQAQWSIIGKQLGIFGALQKISKPGVK